MSADLFLGLMSGTSIDAVDVALVTVTSGKLTLLATWEHPIEEDTRQRIAAISHSGDNEIERMGVLDRELGEMFAEAANALLAQQNIKPHQVKAIGSHGQTIRHRPPSRGHSPQRAFTLQIGDPNTIAELTGITTVADFRRRDIAAGGEGAPLAPAFHAAAFSAAGICRAIVNIGGIANVSLLQGWELAAGWDTGPGNTLMDQWINRHQGQRYDRDGGWAATGTVNTTLLNQLLQHPYLGASGPRSTGKEEFNLQWLDGQLQQYAGLAAVDVMATLSELTAATIAIATKSGAQPVTEVYLCGGGAHNRDLINRLDRRLGKCHLGNTSELGMDPDWVEAAAFAWLAQRTIHAKPGNSTVVTGAKSERILGGIYPA
jgi:anhydro-N-acetylmuramic acid kinase